MPNSNAKPSPPRPSGSPCVIDEQGVYETISAWRRQQTLTKEQLDPCRYGTSPKRRQLFKTGKTTGAATSGSY